MLKTPFTPIKLRDLELKNRFIKSATYEGMSKNGVLEKRLVEFHSRMAEHEVALTTIAYGAVNEDGLTNEDQMVINENAINYLKEISDGVHCKGGKISIQLTHCGYFTRSTRYKSRKPLGPSRTLNKYGIMKGRPYSKAMSLNDINKTIDDFARAALIAKNSNFDAIEIHLGHGYLLSQFLSPAINKRTDNYGGSLENRALLSLEVIAKVREAIGDSIPILCKLNLSDGFAGGFPLEESIEVAKMLESAGVDAIILSGGFTSISPFYLMRGEIPLKEMISSEPNYLQKLALGIFGRQIIKKYEFQENFFLDQATKVRAEINIPLVYIGGAISGKGIDKIFKSGFEMIAMARALIAEPDFIQKLKLNPDHQSPCDQCNICVGKMEIDGIKCVL
ncbi:NADH:flavin oxidoreductase [Bacteroidota bacterium]